MIVVPEKEKKGLGNCKYCGVSFERLIIEAMIVECGGKVYPSPIYCPNGPNHRHG